MHGLVVKPPCTHEDFGRTLSPTIRTADHDKAFRRGWRPSLSPFGKYKEASYDTDPRRYGLQLLDQPVSDKQFDKEYRHKLQAFTNREDAISCACHCNLDSVMCPVYDRVGNEWIYNKEETRRLAEAID
jgi:hypothetical protein